MKGFVLVLVTPFFDYAGPLAMMDLLFKAYNAAATTEKIDPFIVRLHSPRHSLYREILHIQHTENNLSQQDFNRQVVSGQTKAMAAAKFEVGDIEGFGTWIYVAKKQKKKSAAPQAVLHQWKRFERSVLARAA